MGEKGVLAEKGVLSDQSLSAAPEYQFSQAHGPSQFCTSLLVLQEDLVRQSLKSNSWACAGGHAGGQRRAEGYKSLVLILQLMSDLL